MQRNISLGDVTYMTSDKPTKVINQYVLGDVVGEGSFGKVKEGLDVNTLKRVAIKILKGSQLRKIRHGEESVSREISIMRKLKHKNVIELYEVIKDERKDKLFIVLEFAGGGTLHTLIENSPSKRLPPKVIRKYFTQLLEGMEYIHGLGIIHRDIKPQNLLITTDGQLKISDFGVAETLDAFNNSDMCSKSHGSPAFQTPQIARGTENFSGVKSDIWAAGVTLYLMATGEYPFHGENVFHLFENIKKGEFNMPDFVDGSLASLIQGMLRVEEEQRLSIEGIKKHPWLTLTSSDSHLSLSELVPAVSDSSNIMLHVAKALGEEGDGEGGNAADAETDPVQNVVFLKGKVLWSRYTLGGVHPNTSLSNLFAAEHSSSSLRDTEDLSSSSSYSSSSFGIRQSPSTQLLRKTLQSNAGRNTTLPPLLTLPPTRASQDETLGGVLPGTSAFGSQTKQQKKRKCVIL